jgi:hypothetical protein
VDPASLDRLRGTYRRRELFTRHRQGRSTQRPLFPGRRHIHLNDLDRSLTQDLPNHGQGVWPWRFAESLASQRVETVDREPTSIIHTLHHRDRNPPKTSGLLPSLHARSSRLATPAQALNEDNALPAAFSANERLVHPERRTRRNTHRGTGGYFGTDKPSGPSGLAGGAPGCGLLVDGGNGFAAGRLSGGGSFLEGWPCGLVESDICSISLVSITSWSPAPRAPRSTDTAPRGRDRGDRPSTCPGLAPAPGDTAWASQRAPVAGESSYEASLGLAASARVAAIPARASSRATSTPRASCISMAVASATA